MVITLDNDETVLDFRCLENIDDSLKRYIADIESSKPKEEEIFAAQEENCLNLLEKLCGSHPFVINLMSYYLSLPIEQRKKVVEELGWKDITKKKVIRDFANTIQTVMKKK